MTPPKPKGMAMAVLPRYVAKAATKSKPNPSNDPTMVVAFISLRSLPNIPVLRFSRICCSFSAIDKMRFAVPGKICSYCLKCSGLGIGPLNVWALMPNDCRTANFCSSGKASIVRARFSGIRLLLVFARAFLFVDLAGFGFLLDFMTI